MSSRILRAPFPYEPDREIRVPIAERSRRVFLSGARHRRVYPLREGLYRRVAWNPWARRLVDRLAHPGYPDTGRQARHDVVRERYVERAAASTHFFLDPSRYRVELMKYLECAYAGCVPIGDLPSTLEGIVESHFLSSLGRWADLRDAAQMPEEQIRSLASGYRAAMRALESYNDRLTHGQAVFEPRADNLMTTLDGIGKDLGDASSRVDDEIDQNSGNWLDLNADDVFYKNKGIAYAYAIILRDLGTDFKQIIQEKGADNVWQKMIGSLNDARSSSPCARRSCFGTVSWNAGHSSGGGTSGGSANWTWSPFASRDAVAPMASKTTRSPTLPVTRTCDVRRPDASTSV